jgi:DNA-binding MarR family transcriptional regulator
MSNQPLTDRRRDELLDALIAHGHELAHLLASRPLTRASHPRLTADIPPVQLRAMSVLAGGDMRMRELAHRLGLATSTVTRLVDRLEAAGLAERRPERPDRRSVLVGLSTPGQDALTTIQRRLRAYLRELISNLTPREQGELLRLLAKLGSGLAIPPPELAPARVRVR